MMLMKRWEVLQIWKIIIEAKFIQYIPDSIGNLKKSKKIKYYSELE